MAIAIAVVVVVVVAAIVVWMLVTRGPEKTATHEGPRPDVETTADELYRGAERPAGPDAEAQVPPEHPSEPLR